MTNEWQGPIWNDCGGCNSVRHDVERGEGRRWCFWCERDAMERMTNLAANLRIGAALCRAYLLGADGAVSWAMNGRGWEPGCGRKAKP